MKRTRPEKLLSISALIYLGLSAISSQAQTLTFQGIGNPTPSGAYSVTNGVYTIEGGGTDIAGTSDKFHFLYKAMTGDGAITARVNSVESTHTYAKAGVMIRETLDSTSRFYSTLVHANNSVRFQRRAGTDPNMVSSGSGGGFPRWVRISRTGTSIASSHSNDGINWTSLGTVTVTNTGTVYVGLAVCSHNDAQLSTAILDNVSLPAGSGLAAAAVGSVPAPGTNLETTGGMTIEGAGSDIGGTSDQFYYVYKPMPGVGVMTARVASVEYTHQYAKAGLMIRESLAPGARHYTTLAHANANVRFQRRTITDGTMTTGGSGSGLPRWLRIERLSDRIVSSHSADGVTWSALGTEMVSNLGTVYIGFAVSSYSSSQLATAVFENVTLPTFVDTDGDQLPDIWETSYGLNPNSAADGSLDSDGDGLTNLQEYWGLTNPSVSNAQSGGTITLAAITSSAHEMEGTTALLRLIRTGGSAARVVSLTRSGTAANEDYTLKDPSGNTVTNTVAFPSGLTSLDLTVLPIADGAQEYPESLSVTVAPGTGYTVGTQATASVTLNDASDIAANEQLFVANLKPAPGVTENSSGLVQLYLNGTKTSARVIVTPHALSSVQSNTYIRWGVTDGPGPELRPNLGVGSLTATWSIQPTAHASGQDIIDGLYRNGGQYVYLNIGTERYPGGEIEGTFTRQNGSRTFTVPPAPPSLPTLTGTDLTRDVTRFLTQATFGPTQAEIDALVTRINTQHGGNRIAGYTAWIDEQLARDFSSHHAYVIASKYSACGGTLPTASSPQLAPLNLGNAAGAAWWTAALKAHDQLRQRYTFALSEIFVVARNMQPLTTLPEGPVNYYDMLGSHTTGNFRNLLEDVSKHPVMGEYLSHKQNRKAIYDSQGKLISSPDENYAREIMQLFSIGLAGLHPDGSLKLDSAGALIPTYNNSDIANLARVFTGWSYGMNFDSATPGTPVVNPNFHAGTGAGTALYTYYQYGWIYPMRNFESEHDRNSKTFLGATVPGNLDGEPDLDAALNIIYAHANVAPFISRLLIQRLVTSNPTNGYVYRVAQKFENNGSGVRGDMKAVIKAILLDYEARSLSLTTSASYGKQKEPIVRYVQLLRALNAVGIDTLSQLASYMDPEQYNNYPAGTFRYTLKPGEVIAGLAQYPLSAPSVFNWFLPDYSPPGPISAAGLVAPEMNLTTESNAFAVINFFYQMTHTTYGVNNCSLRFTELATKYDTLKAGGSNDLQASTALFDYLDTLLTAGSFKTLYGGLTSPNPRSMIIDAVATTPVADTDKRMRELVYLIATSPEFVHQR